MGIKDINITTFNEWSCKQLNIDEVQNYLPNQIDLIKSTADSRLKSILYVRDLAQQTHLGTLKSWDEIKKVFTEENKAILEKVYRNTRQILEFIKSLGFNVSTGDKLREGTEFTETTFDSIENEISHIKNIITKKEKEVIGILVKTGTEKNIFAEHLQIISNNDVRIMTINESQGVEFDTAILAGVSKESYTSTHSNPVLRAERQKVNRDLLYMGLTRAINELHITGKDKISDILINSL